MRMPSQLDKPTVKQKRKMAEKINVLRTRRGWSQEKVCELIGCSAGLCGHWETARAMPSLLMATRLADLFDITLDELMRGIE